MSENNRQLEQDQGETTGPPREVYCAEDEIDLLELIKPLWKQKLMILAITILATVTAVVLVLRATPLYRIYTQFKPGIYRWDAKGTPIAYLKAADLKNLLTSGVFETYFEQSYAGKKEPKIEARTDRGGSQVSATIFWPDREKGKQIMAGFVGFLNDPLRGAVLGKTSLLQRQRLILEKSINTITEQIKNIEVDKDKALLQVKQQKGEFKLVDLQVDKLKRAIESIRFDVQLAQKEQGLLQERIKLAEETRTGYEKSRLEVEHNTSRLIALRDQLLQSPGSDKLQLLLLANTTQQNIAYLDTIEQKIETLRKESIDYRKNMEFLIHKQEKDKLQIADLEDRLAREIPKQKADIQKAINELQLRIDKEIPVQIALQQQQIDEIKDRIKSIALVEVVEPPQASIKPVKPKKRKTVALAGIMGFFLAIILAYLRHFWFVSRTRLES